MKSLKYTLTLVITLIVFNVFSSMESDYRRAKRDAKTREEISKDDGFRNGVLYMIIAVVGIGVILMIQQKNKVKNTENKYESDYLNEIEKLSILFKVNKEDLKEMLEIGIFDFTIDTNFDVKLLDPPINNLFTIKRNQGGKYEKTYNHLLILKQGVIDTIHKTKLVDKYGEEKGSQIFNNQYYIGMTKEELKDGRGEPTKIELERLKTKTKELWIYGNKNSGDVFIFENDLLVKFIDR